MKQPITLSLVNKIKIYIGSTLLLISMVISALIVGPLILICFACPFHVRYYIAYVWIKWVMWIVNVCCGIRFTVEGLENIKAIPTAIVLSKHQSAWETLALRVILPRQTTLLKRSLLQIPVWGWALSLLKPIAIDRTQQRAALKMLIQQGTVCLNEGLWVVVFPEGTRTAPGETKKFNAGGAILAEKSGYPVIPIAHNAGQYWARNSFLKYPGMITVRIGPVIESQGKKAAEINSLASAWIAAEMLELEA
ncbi:MAG: 1-acyl-sn-glycerol-3-phosphate acyltransferase [Methylovulum sp.]|jgi:1-acyl-sn-glycerol-3-phosphate acyltransferase|nr:1-acyl-sn-glycerol-3-phosphate acyltransferase [Methylovulum sp.]